jgi:alkylhydroperoxidase family enzyme
MNEFPLHTMDTAPEASREVLGAIGRSEKELPNMLRTMAESPAALSGFDQLRRAFAQSSLSPLEQQVVYLTVAQANGCHYCTAQTDMFDDSPTAQDAAKAILNDRPLADRRMQALRRFADRVARQQGWVAGDAVEAFLGAGYTQAQVLDVICGVALATFSSYTNHIAATPVDGATAKLSLVA